MADPIQQHFLGCSIRNFNVNVGWANQASTLSVGLVEDDCLYERFDGAIGSLVRFQYDNFIFDGILTTVKETKSENGNRLWEATISDPRELLSGVQMIIGGYTGFTYNVHNLYNIYGYLENTGYGNSQINEAGIPWYLIRNAFTQLNQATPLYLNGVPLFVDLSDLPSVSPDYRISSTNISLLDFIQEICELANFDFTVVMIGSYIKVSTISRNIIQLNGSIYRFLNNIPQFTNLEAGFELQYNVANKFLVGGQVEQMYYQFNNGSGTNSITSSPYDDTITRYWGKDLFGNVKIANRLYSSGVSIKTPNNVILPEVNEQFRIDGKPMSFPGNSWYDYPTDMDELRCAIESRESWELFLWSYSLSSNNSGSIHYGKADKLKLPPDATPQVISPISNIFNLKPKDFAKLERNVYIASNYEQYIQKVYDYVSTFAKEHLDKKFMVRVPFVFAKYEEDGTIKTSLEPTETGYIEESFLPNVIGNRYLPGYSDFLLSPENKIYCYVRFGPFNSVDLDLSELSEDDYYSEGEYLFVKASVEPDLVFLNSRTAFSPRAVVTLPGRVKYNDETVNLNLLAAEYVRQKPDIVLPGQTKSEKELAAINFGIWSRQVGADTFYIDKSRYGLAPEMIAIPLKDNTKTYGPWYTQNIDGIVEFVQDHDLVPWNYGGFRQMNLCAQGMVNDVLLTTMIGEAGSVEVPGSPDYNIAQEIIANGPPITQISVSIGENGVSTTYRFERWNQEYGKETRHRIDTYKKFHLLKRESTKKFTKLLKPSPPFKNIKFGSTAANLAAAKPRRIQSRTSHPVIMASTFTKENGKLDYNIGSMPMYQIQNTLDAENWESIAGVSFDGLYAPFTTDTRLISGMPHFESPSGNYTGPDANDLNPFNPGHNISIAVVGRGVSGHRSISLSDSGNYDVHRGIGLKGPLVICGWGYDIDGKPVPNGLTQTSGQLPGSGTGVSGLINVSGDAFHPDYLQDISLWKTGPLDCRWDDERKVWVAGSSVDPYIRNFRTLNVSGVTLFQLERFSKGSGNWVTWFISADCTTV